MTFSDSINPENKASIIFIGSPGPFSASVFRTLLTRGITVSHVVCAGIAPAGPVERSLPVAFPDQDNTLANLASRYHIPLDYISRPSDLQTPALKLPENPDYVLVACFPFRVPETITCSPRIACLNIHPSLLPRYRGPDPIFWQLKYGEPLTGISLHQLTAEFDAGPVVMQKMVAYEEGAYKQDIETLLGKEGAELFSTVITDGLSINQITHVQDETDSSYFPAPSSDDYQVFDDWSARRVFNFIRGTWPPIDQYIIYIGDSKWIITQALGYSSDDHIPEPIQVNKDELYIQFSPGILHAHGFEA